jgi:hypothetical protein
MTRPLQSCYSLRPMAYSKPRPNRPMPGDPSGLARALGAVWRLFFAFDRPPRNIYERHYVRARAGFYFLLGVAATLAVQAAIGRLKLWPM